jgi:hypothetical protein
MITAALVPSNPVVALFVALVLFVLGRLIIVRVVRPEESPWLSRLLTWSLVLHLLAAPAQIWVVVHIYHNVADWNGYTHQGALAAANYRHFDFSNAGTGIRKIVNDGSVSVADGIVMTFVGSNLMATFFVFAWLAFIGGILYFRAFTMTFVGADHRRYALLILLLPSLLFWTADVSKEAIMFFALAVIVYGMARVFSRRPGGYLIILPGVLIGFLIRPNELLLLAGAFAVGMVLRAVTRSERGGLLRQVLSLCFCGLLLFVCYAETEHYLTHGGQTLSSQLQNTNAHNADAGASGGIPYSQDPATYPRDVYEVMFNPLPFNFHGKGELVAAIENTILLIVLLRSFRQLRIVPRVSVARPYVMMCLVYSVGWIYVFAALGNLGLIERERTLMLPFLLVLLCIPRGEGGAPPRYEWELRRRYRQRFQRYAASMGYSGITRIDVPLTPGGQAPATGGPVPPARRAPG